ncbi:hypothetical protein EDC96DRAFT_498621 [Choanephora cucurbitarum]|nr:hypothetical protein EDC96DRAFT_498621 [Choanephora cucurbitarum]
MICTTAITISNFDLLLILLLLLLLMTFFLKSCNERGLKVKALKRNRCLSDHQLHTTISLWATLFLTCIKLLTWAVSIRF